MPPAPASVVGWSAPVAAAYCTAAEEDVCCCGAARSMYGSHWVCWSQLEGAISSVWSRSGRLRIKPLTLGLMSKPAGVLPVAGSTNPNFMPGAKRKPPSSAIGYSLCVPSAPKTIILYLELVIIAIMSAPTKIDCFKPFTSP